MKINGINISSFKAELNGRTITENTVTQNLSFNAVMSLVSHSGQELGAKSIALEFIIYCDSEDDFFYIKSQMIKELKSCTLTFPDITREFKAYLKGADDYTKLKNGVYRLSVDLEGDYAIGNSCLINKNNVTSIECNNLGVYPAPIIMKITCSEATDKIIITGFNDDITIKNLKANTPIIIDTANAFIADESGTNMFKNYDSWSLPVLPVGTTILNFSTACNVEINYNELF